MKDLRTLQLLVPEPIRRFPADLAVVVVLVIFTCIAVLISGDRWTSIQVALGLPFLFFLPGYALVAALFPENEGNQTKDEKSEKLRWIPSKRIDELERVALSFGLSLAIVPLIGFVLNFTPFGLRRVPVLVSISGWTIILAVLATVRRWNLPPDERFRVRYDQWFVKARSALLRPDSSFDKTLNVMLAISLLLAAGSVTFAVTSSKSPQLYTEFYLLTENDGGELTAYNYPTEYVSGEEQQLVVGIDNHQRTSMNYTVVVELQRTGTESDSARVIEKQELHRFRAVLDANETWYRTHNVTPTMSGQNLRLQYMLFRGDAPPAPQTADAHEEIHIPINVSESDDDAALRFVTDE